MILARMQRGICAPAETARGLLRNLVVRADIPGIKPEKVTVAAGPRHIGARPARPPPAVAPGSESSRTIGPSRGPPVRTTTDADRPFREAR